MTLRIAIPDKKGLRNFGLTTGIIVAILFGLLLPWLLGRDFPLWPWVIGGILAGWALLAPTTLRPLYLGWMAAGHVLGWINTKIILLVMFYIVVLPTGIILRSFGKDPMARRLEAQVSTYRVPSTNQPKNHLEKPF